MIDGVLLLSDMVFARFTANSEECLYKISAIGNNPLSPDAVHPIVMTTTTLLNYHPDSLVFFHDPDPDWINQEVISHLRSHPLELLSKSLLQL